MWDFTVKSLHHAPPLRHVQSPDVFMALCTERLIDLTSQGQGSGVKVKLDGSRVPCVLKVKVK